MTLRNEVEFSPLQVSLSEGDVDDDCVTKNANVWIIIIQKTKFKRVQLASECGCLVMNGRTPRVNLVD